MIKRIYRKLQRMLIARVPKFDSTGERVDILYKDQINFDTLDMFQKSHYKRYERALDLIGQNEVCGDFACGTGYGSIMLAKKAKKVIGADINEKVIRAIRKRYKKITNVTFINGDLLNVNLGAEFDNIVSFETIEHFNEDNIYRLLAIFNKCLKPSGKLIISTPYMQERDEAALKLGHHLTFYIDEKIVMNWLSANGFSVLSFQYQNYDTHIIKDHLEKKDFIVCLAQKNSA